MLGLTFAQAQARFDARRELVVSEANAIGTTWLRADQLAPADATTFRKLLTQYTDDRLQAYSSPGNTDLAIRVIRDSENRQAQMWTLASNALRERPGDLGRSLLMTTLNETIDLSAEQLAALTHHVPTAVLVFTLLLVVLASASIGLQFGRNKSRPAKLTVVFALAFTAVLSLVVDYDRAQIGFVQVPLDPLAIQLNSMQQ